MLKVLPTDLDMGIIDEIYPDIEKFKIRYEPIFCTETYVKTFGLCSLTVQYAILRFCRQLSSREMEQKFVPPSRKEFSKFKIASFQRPKCFLT